MNRAEHRMRMCFDEEYSRSYNSFLSRKKVLIEVYNDIFKDEVSGLIVGHLIVFLLGNFGIYISSLVLSVPLKLLTFLKFSGIVIISFIIVLSVFVPYFFMLRTMYIRPIYKNIMGRYLNK